MIWSMMEMSIKCPECDSPVHIDGPYRKVHCDRCQSDIDFPESVWKDLLGDVPGEVRGFQPGEGSGSTIFGHFNMNMTYGRLAPYCSKCKRNFKMDEDYNGTDKVTCPDCKTEVPAFPAPEWFAQALSGASIVVGAWPEANGTPEPTGLSGPVSFSCPQCAGNLLIDGKERIISCQYCETNVYLPDDLWLRLHPAKKKNRWFIGLTG